MVKDDELDEIIKEKQEHNVQTKSSTQEDHPDDVRDLVDKGIGAAVVAKIQNEESTQKSFMTTAEKIVKTQLNRASNDAEKDEKAAMLANNKDACDLYGIDEKTVPQWVVRCAKKVQDFWYAVWLIVGFFTTAPVVFLSKKIKVIFKKTWVSVALAVVIYLAITMAPIWIKAVNSCVAGN